MIFYKYILSTIPILKGADRSGIAESCYDTQHSSTHIPGTLRAIPSGVLNRLAKLTSRNPSIHAEAVYNIYPAHVNALCKAGLAPSVFPTMGYLCRKQYEKVETEKEKDVSEKKTEMSTFVLPTHVTFLHQSTG